MDHNKAQQILEEYDPRLTDFVTYNASDIGFEQLEDGEYKITYHPFLYHYWYLPELMIRTELQNKLMSKTFDQYIIWENDKILAATAKPTNDEIKAQVKKLMTTEDYNHALRHIKYVITTGTVGNYIDLLGDIDKVIF